jgi:hypothetical protein
MNRRRRWKAKAKRLDNRNIRIVTRLGAVKPVRWYLKRLALVKRGLIVGYY